MRAKIWWQPTIRSGSLTRRPSFGLSLPIRQARAATAPSGTNADDTEDEVGVRGTVGAGPATTCASAAPGSAAAPRSALGRPKWPPSLGPPPTLQRRTV